MRGTGVWVSVFRNSIIHQSFPEFLQPLSPRSILGSFLFVLGVLLAWVSSVRPDLSSTEFDTCTGEISLSIRSPRSWLWLSLTVGEEDKVEEDDEEWLSCLEGVFEVDDPRSIVTVVGNTSSFMPITLLQHSYCTFVIILFGPFSRLFINLTVCVWALFTKPTTTLGLVEQAFWKVPLFTKWVIASSSKVILARPSRHSTAGTSASGTSGSRWFSLSLLHERIRRRIRLCDFFHA